MSFYHVFPVNDLKEHSDDSACECHPEIEVMPNGNIIVVHNVFDGREEKERVTEDNDFSDGFMVWLDRNCWKVLN